MEAPELLARITHPDSPTPPIRDIPAVFALRLAEISGRLTEQELEAFVELGAVINERCRNARPRAAADR